MRINPKYKGQKYICLEITSSRDDICNDFRIKIRINPKYKNRK